MLRRRQAERPDRGSLRMEDLRSAHRRRGLRRRRTDQDSGGHLPDGQEHGLVHRRERPFGQGLAAQLVPEHLLPAQRGRLDRRLRPEQLRVDGHIQRLCGQRGGKARRPRRRPVHPERCKHLHRGQKSCGLRSRTDERLRGRWLGQPRPRRPRRGQPRVDRDGHDRADLPGQPGVLGHVQQALPR